MELECDVCGEAPAPIKVYTRSMPIRVCWACWIVTEWSGFEYRFAINEDAVAGPDAF